MAGNFFAQLYNDLSGRTSANSSTNLGVRNAGQINSGYDRADSEARTGYDTSMGFYQPYADSGRRGQTAYENTLGLNGQEARQKQFTEGYTNDPALAYRNQNNQNQMNSMFRKYNAGGQGVNSGAAMLGAGRLATEQFNNDWGGYQNRLMGMGQQGLQVAGQQAGLTTGYYGGNADRAIGRSTALTSNDTQATQAANNARMAGVNNLLTGMGALGGQVFSAFAPGASTALKSTGVQNGGTSPGGVPVGGTWGKPNPYASMGGAYGGGF